MNCCENKQLVHVSAKCSDMCYVEFPNGTDSDSYVPHNIGIGGGDYIKFSYCLNCGKIQDNFPFKCPKSEFDEDEE